MLPSFAWMFFYLKKDTHREPLSIIIKVFLAGCLVVVPVAAIELAIIGGANYFLKKVALLGVIVPFILAPFIEEIFKFAAVKKSIEKNKEFDEPVDAMTYMVVGALGFAAVENFIYLLKIAFDFPAPFVVQRQFASGEEFFYTFILRGSGATLLHALASASLGYFWALAIIKNKIGSLYHGVLSAGLLHLAFNGIIIAMGEYFIFPLIFLLLLGANSVGKKFKRLNQDNF